MLPNIRTCFQSKISQDQIIKHLLYFFVLISCSKKKFNFFLFLPSLLYKAHWILHLKWYAAFISKYVISSKSLHNPYERWISKDSSLNTFAYLFSLCECIYALLSCQILRGIFATSWKSLFKQPITKQPTYQSIWSVKSIANKL